MYSRRPAYVPNKIIANSIITVSIICARCALLDGAASRIKKMKKVLRFTYLKHNISLVLGCRFAQRVFLT